MVLQRLALRRSKFLIMRGTGKERRSALGRDILVVKPPSIGSLTLDGHGTRPIRGEGPVDDLVPASQIPGRQSAQYTHAGDIQVCRQGQQAEVLQQQIRLRGHTVGQDLKRIHLTRQHSRAAQDIGHVSGARTGHGNLGTDARAGLRIPGLDAIEDAHCLPHRPHIAGVPRARPPWREEAPLVRGRHVGRQEAIELRRAAFLLPPDHG